MVDLLADRIAVLNHGELVEQGPAAQVLGDPQHPYTRRLLASLPVPDPVEQAQRREALVALRAAPAAADQRMPDLPAVSARDLSIYYRSRNPVLRSIAVNGVNFEVPQGEVLAIVGETGSGKSTLAQTLALRGGPDRRRLAADPRRLAVDPGRAGAEPVAAQARPALGARGLHPAERQRQPRSRLHDRREHRVADPVAGPQVRQERGARARRDARGRDAAAAEHHGRVPVRTQQGQRQRVAIARALILEPAVLIADDPTAGIDATVRRSVLDVIGRMQRERLFSAIVVTADLNEVRRIATRMAVMHAGSIVGIGPVDEVLQNPTHPYVKGLAKALAEGRRWSRRSDRAGPARARSRRASRPGRAGARAGRSTAGTGPDRHRAR